MLDLIDSALESLQQDLFVAMPGRVESYDAGNQTATIRPMLRRLVPTPDEDDIVEEIPLVYSVPVIHYGGAGWRVHVPLAAGDTVLLVYLQWDPSEWIRTGDLSEPADQRMHSASYPVAIPGLRHSKNKIEGASSSDVTIEKDGFKITISDKLVVGGDSDAAALASKVDDALQEISQAFATFVPGTGGANFPNPYLYTSSTASQKLKVNG